MPGPSEPGQTLDHEWTGVRPAAVYQTAQTRDNAALRLRPVEVHATQVRPLPLGLMEDTTETDHIATLVALLVQVELLMAQQRQMLTAVIDALIGGDGD